MLRLIHITHISTTVWPCLRRVSTTVWRARLQAGDGKTTPEDKVNFVWDHQQFNRPSSHMIPHFGFFPCDRSTVRHGIGRHFRWHIRCYFYTKWEKIHRRVVFPRLHTHDCFPEEVKILEGASHGRIYSSYTFLSRHARAISCLQETTHRCLDGIHSRIVRRNSDRSSNVGSDAYPRTSVS